MNAASSEVIQLAIGAVVGFGLSLSMENRGITLFSRETGAKALGYLFIFCTAWIVLSTGMMALFAA